MSSESKHEKFKRLAEMRGNRILRDLDLLGNLSNRSNYKYSTEEIRHMFLIIDEQLKITKNRFKNTRSKNREIKL